MWHGNGVFNVLLQWLCGNDVVVGGMMVPCVAFCCGVGSRHAARKSLLMLSRMKSNFGTMWIVVTGAAKELQS